MPVKEGMSCQVIKGERRLRNRVVSYETSAKAELSKQEEKRPETLTLPSRNEMDISFESQSGDSTPTKMDTDGDEHSKKFTNLTSLEKFIQAQDPTEETEYRGAMLEDTSPIRKGWRLSDQMDRRIMETSPAGMRYQTPRITSLRSRHGVDLGDSGLESPPSRLMSTINPGKRVLSRNLMDVFGCSPIPYSPELSECSVTSSDDSLMKRKPIRHKLEELEEEQTKELPAEPVTPPNAKMAQLRLFDNASQTPKVVNRSMSRFPRFFAKRKPSPLLFKQTSPTTEQNVEEPLPIFKLNKRRYKLKPCPANYNPFTPEGAVRKVAITNGTEKNTGYRKRVSIHDVTTTRYNKEFEQLELLGNGSFGTVYKVESRLSGVFYAIKCSKQEMPKEPPEAILREVYAQAVIGQHPNIVRYFSAWIENRCLYIQNEYCDGGSLTGMITENRAAQTFMNEKDLRLVLKHIAQGLKYLHTLEIVHMDIKPDNIFMCVDKQLITSTTIAYAELLLDDVDTEAPMVIYKIGDFGMVCTPKFYHGEDGDSRYMAPELFNDSHQDLYKVDIFSLAMSIFDAGSVEPLPKGDRWQATKIDKWNEEVSGLWARSTECFQKLLKLMITADPLERISAAQILEHAYFTEGNNKTIQNLTHELSLEKAKSENLTKQVAELLEHVKQSEESKKTLEETIVSLLEPVAQRVTRSSTQSVNKSFEVCRKRECSDIDDCEAPQRKSQRLVGLKTKKSMSASTM